MSKAISDDMLHHILSPQPKEIDMDYERIPKITHADITDHIFSELKRILNIDYTDQHNNDRHQEYNYFRKLYYYYCSKHTDLSHERIAGRFKKDRTTILYHLRETEVIIKYDPDFKRLFDKVECEILI